MKNNNYKIVVLTDLKKSAKSELKSAVSLAKMMDSNIMLLHVKKPTDLVNRESQLSAMRTINQEQLASTKQLKDLVKPYNNDHTLHIGCKVVIGNLKNEVGTYLNRYKPDVVVLGKKNTKSMSIIGDNLTKFVMNKHKGTVMITGDTTLNETDEVSLGVLNPNVEEINLETIEGLINRVKEPIKAFSTANNGKSRLKAERMLNGKKAVEYIFDDANKAIDSVSKYASKNNINLLCVDKTEANIKNLLNKLNVSILLTEKQPTIIYN